jgi:protein Mpv17
VVVNQLCFSPVFNTYFFGMQSLLSNLPRFDAQAIWLHIKHTVPTSAWNSCKLWPAVTAFSFTFVPAWFRSVFASHGLAGLPVLPRTFRADGRGEGGPCS